jgi:hypothetical protein
MKEKVANFIDFYQRQDVNERRRIREEFLKTSGLSYPAWYAKLQRKKFSALEIRALEDICHQEF